MTVVKLPRFNNNLLKTQEAIVVTMKEDGILVFCLDGSPLGYIGDNTTIPFGEGRLFYKKPKLVSYASPTSVLAETHLFEAKLAKNK